MSKKNKVEKKSAPKTKKAAVESKATVNKADVDKAAKKIKKELGPKEVKENTQFGDPVSPEVLIGTLAQSSMLVRARIKVWSGTKADKDWADILAGTAQGMKGSFSVVVKILPPSMRSELGKRVSKFTQVVKNNSIPWRDGWDLIATSIYVDLKKTLEVRATEVRDYVEEIARRRDEIVEHAKINLGKAYNDTRVPTADEIRKSLAVVVDKSDVHIPQKLEGVDDQNMEELREEMMADVRRRYNAGIMELVDSLRETMERLVEEMDKNENDKASYKRTLEMCDSRIESILRLDVFKSKRIYAALEHINDNVLNPIREHLADLKKADKKDGAKGALKKSRDDVKKAAGMLDGLTV